MKVKVGPVSTIHTQTCYNFECVRTVSCSEFESTNLVDIRQILGHLRVLSINRQCMEAESIMRGF